VKRQSIQRVLEYRDWAELAADAKYDAETLASLCEVSLRTLERFFHKNFQSSPQRWLDQLRKIEAVLLVHAGLRKKEIANRLGFKQQSHLSRIIKQPAECSTATPCSANDQRAEARASLAEVIVSVP
jgi:transcriptional regulator GlxA family with amidase domain